MDIYGSCGSLKCSRGNKQCFEMLNTDYKFYLAFENSNCGDYITEKFWLTALQHSVSAVKRSIGFTIGFHNHGEGPY